jgi:hypothetical protein
MDACLLYPRKRLGQECGPTMSSMGKRKGYSVTTGKRLAACLSFITLPQSASSLHQTVNVEANERVICPTRDLPMPSLPGALEHPVSFPSPKFLDNYNVLVLSLSSGFIRLHPSTA